MFHGRFADHFSLSHASEASDLTRRAPSSRCAAGPENLAKARQKRRAANQMAGDKTRQEEDSAAMKRSQSSISFETTIARLYPN